MGMLMSYMGGKGNGSTQILSLLVDTLYSKFVDKDIKDFEMFHIAILDIFNTINMALPGKHYDAPSHKDVEDFFNQWDSKDTEDERKKTYTEFMKKNVNLSKVDLSMMVTGVVAPPAAMVVKRTGQNVQQLSAMKVVPDVVFVPTATILTLIGVKVTRKIFMPKVTS